MADHHGGWGTLEGVRLSVLVLADPERDAAARGVARALRQRHDVELLAEARGAISSHLEAARAARTLAPRVVHGVGARGFGSAAAPVARGVGAKYVVALSSDDLSSCRHRKLARIANRADAVVLDDDALVDPLREAGMKRDVYILPSPSGSEEDAPYLAGIEIVYGRILAGEAEPDAKPDDQIVRIGGLRRSSER